ncbi:MAG: hypothetical protein WC314_12365 [Vulcanimicrobiota bacterium]
MINGTAEQFQKFVTDYNNMMMDGWSSWTKQTIQSDAFTSASGAFMDWSLATHKMMSELSGQVMESLDVPKRSDLARVSAQVQSVESRLLDQQDSQEELRELLMTIIQKIDNLPAPVPAPEQATTVEPATEKKPGTSKASATGKVRKTPKKESR